MTGSSLSDGTICAAAESILRQHCRRVGCRDDVPSAVADLQRRNGGPISPAEVGAATAQDAARVLDDAGHDFLHGAVYGAQAPVPAAQRRLTQYPGRDLCVARGRPTRLHPPC